MKHCKRSAVKRPTGGPNLRLIHRRSAKLPALLALIQLSVAVVDIIIINTVPDIENTNLSGTSGLTPQPVALNLRLGYKS
jgi:hypothetical protein